LKIHNFFCENPRIIFVLFYDVHKENMFTINLEDGREAPSKASFLNFTKYKTFEHKFLKFWSFINLPWGHVRSHTKFWPDRFSRFDVYWIQTNRQAKFIYRCAKKFYEIRKLFCFCFILYKKKMIWDKASIKSWR